MDTSILIMVVDDEKPIRENIKYHLNKMGFNKFIEADNGSTALQHLWAENVGLILSDWYMPDMDGLELLKHVRANSSLDEIPFLMITSNKEKGSVVEAVQEGVNHYIIKPFTGEVLTNKIKQILKPGN